LTTKYLSISEPKEGHMLAGEKFSGFDARFFNFKSLKRGT
jgi:hypothetical protein